jgi:hypothetical protein
MAATTAGALKAYLEAQGLGLAVFRDDAQTGQALPYATVTEAVTVTADGAGDTGDTGAARYVTELAQVDLWQTWRAENGAIAESYTLPGAIVRCLQGAQLTSAPTRVYGCTVDSMVRLLERDTNLVHHAVTVRIRRAL